MNDPCDPSSAPQDESSTASSLKRASEDRIFTSLTLSSVCLLEAVNLQLKSANAAHRYLKENFLECEQTQLYLQALWRSIIVLVDTQRFLQAITLQLPSSNDLAALSRKTAASGLPPFTPPSSCDLAAPLSSKKPSTT